MDIDEVPDDYEDFFRSGPIDPREHAHSKDVWFLILYFCVRVILVVALILVMMIVSQRCKKHRERHHQRMNRLLMLKGCKQKTSALRGKSMSQSRKSTTGTTSTSAGATKTTGKTTDH